MPSQSGSNVIVGYKVEATYNTAPGTGSAEKLRFVSGGLSLARANIASNEIRSDGLTTMSRLGSRQVSGGYSCELSLGSFDTLLEAAMRSTWVAASTVTFDNGAALTSLEVSDTNTLTFAGTTTPAAAGIRVGDVIRLSNMSTAANNSINLRVKAVGSSTVDVHGTPLTVQAADTACSITILRKLKNGTTPTKRTFYFEEYNQDIDVSEVFGGCKIVGFRIRGTPDGMATIELQIMGASQSVLATGDSPYYASPTEYTTIPLVFADATISFNGSDIAVATGFELNYSIGANTQPVIGTTVSPDVFDNMASLSGSLDFIRQDLANVSTFLAETEVELHLLLVEPDSEPKDCIAIYVPRIKLMNVDAPLGGDGAMVETVNWTAGAKVAATGYDGTLLTISTSAS